MSTYKCIIERLLSKFTSSKVIHQKNDLPFSGFDNGRVSSGVVERLSDDDLQRLNHLLPWKCFTVDLSGRRFGNRAWVGKREAPEIIPDVRIVKLDEIFGLKDKTVLEIGCFEGIHTIGLSQLSRATYAVDSRIENVVKTIVRTNLFGFRPVVTVCDVENESELDLLPEIDVLHHVGVLYHLKDPVSHLINVLDKAKLGILLDTHYASEEMINDSYSSQRGKLQCYSYKEYGRDEVFSGMYDHAKWLLLDDVIGILSDAGFSDIEIFKNDKQRNGPRVTLYARKQ